MKIPSWFVIGCGLLALNLILVLGGTVSRYASAEAPDDRQKLSEPPSQLDAPGAQDAAEFASSEVASPTLAIAPSDALPTVPSLENLSPAMPGVVSIAEIESAIGELPPANDLLAPLDAMMKAVPAPVSEQLSHSFFESLKLRLRTSEHLNKSTIGLVDEAAILYQRGEIAEAQKLLGLATQLREMTARLLVTHP